jgi:hypothetical protein
MMVMSLSPPDPAQKQQMTRERIRIDLIEMNISKICFSRRNIVQYQSMKGIFDRYFSNRRTAARVMAALLACTYFAFRTELFSEEFEENSPKPAPVAGTMVFSVPSTNWETFDKDNAPKAFRINPCLPLGLLATVPAQVLPPAVVPEQQTIIRDKSPPSFS